ncbi:Alpha/Beta hydrolase protein [Cladochytrium replicatum]|nr:Alpha/Beta hydrolase protein [Cladochytrium replicatum]
MLLQHFTLEGSSPGISIVCSVLSAAIGPTPTVALLYHHATGFHKEVYYPIMETLVSNHTGLICIGIDARNHGDRKERDPEEPSEDGYVWWNSAFDAVKVAEWFGGSVLLAAEVLRPGLFERLYLVEPVTMEYSLMVRWLEEFSGNEEIKDSPPHPDAPWFRTFVDEMASKRKSTWPTRDDVRSNFMTKSTFTNWDHECLELHLKHWLYETPTGQVALKCHPRLEAATFRGQGMPRLFEALTMVNIPCRVVTGSESYFVTTITMMVDGKIRTMTEQIAERLPNSTELMVSNAGHLSALEVPEVIAEDASRFLFGSMGLFEKMLYAAESELKLVFSGSGGPVQVQAKL